MPPGQQVSMGRVFNAYHVGKERTRLITAIPGMFVALMTGGVGAGVPPEPTVGVPTLARCASCSQAPLSPRCRRCAG
jgi:hypothetical protein